MHKPFATPPHRQHDLTKAGRKRAVLDAGILSAALLIAATGAHADSAPLQVNRWLHPSLKACSSIKARKDRQFCWPTPRAPALAG